LIGEAVKSIPLKTKTEHEVSFALFAGGLLRFKVTGLMKRSEMTWQLKCTTSKCSLERKVKKQIQVPCAACDAMSEANGGKGCANLYFPLKVRLAHLGEERTLDALDAKRVLSASRSKKSPIVKL
jgi:hypothetical protein